MATSVKTAPSADSFKRENSLSLDYWANRWTNDETGWHENDGNKIMWRHFRSVLASHLPVKKANQLKVFVPLCGKAKDMYLLYQMGFIVVGVEYTKQAIDEFFNENNLEEKENPTAPFRSSKDGRMILGQGDLFTFSGDQTSPNPLPFEKFDVIWDRGSLEALNSKERLPYTTLMTSLLADDGFALISTKDYDQAEYGGPPMPVRAEDLSMMYGRRWRVNFLEREDVIDTHPKWRKAGLTRLDELLHTITLIKEMQEEDVSASANTLTLDFWDDRWANAMTGWHEANGNKMLWSNLPSILEENLPGKKAEELKVFVPLCGKAKDMYLFYEMGFTVVGVEYTKQAIDEFFTENNLEEKENPTAPFRSSKDGRMILGQGDLFTFSGDQTSPNPLPFEKFDVIWDRGSFEAINAEDRTRYAELMLSLLTDDGVYIMDTFVYDKNEYGGPPLSADTEDLKAAFGDGASVVLLKEEDKKDVGEILGLSKCTEQLNLITLTKSS